MRAKNIPGFAFVLSVVAALPFAGQAAPQILGLVATLTPLPMSCDGEVCSVEVSGVCLQEHRPAPQAGTAYRVAQGSELTLVVPGLDGVRRTLPVADLVEIKSLRVFSSVAVSLPQSFVQKHGGDITRASLSVAPLTTLLPVPEAGDPAPLTAQEIREVTGPLRTVAERAIGHDTANLTATRVLNHMVNRLPADASVGATRIAGLRDQARGLEATGLVNRALDLCREKVRVAMSPHLRACLANQHDILNSNTTRIVWRSLRPGS